MTSLVKGLIKDAAGKLTGTSFVEKLNELVINKSIAIQVIAISNGLSFGRGKLNLVNTCKAYLLERCAKSSNYTDPITGLTVNYNDKTRITVTSDEIVRLKVLVKVEEEKILAKELDLSKGRKVTDAINAKLAKSIKGAVIKRAAYKSWGIVK